MPLRPRELGVALEQQDYDSIYAATSVQFKDFIGRVQFVQLCRDFCVDEPQFTLVKDYSFLDVHNYVWLDKRKDKAVFAAFDADNIIQGMYFKPYVTYPKSDKRYTKNKYRMPIIGEWYVFWGGTNEFQNYHYPYVEQRYAYDLVKVENQQTYLDSKLWNSNFFAFNEHVVAPLEGTVVAVVDGFVDNEPGEMDENHTAGNYVVLAHPNEEFSMLAHFRKGSILVKVGDKVVTGQPLGRCGNSGNSSEPHIHFQVMDLANVDTAQSLRIRFDGHSEPVQGDIVNSAVYTDEEKLDKSDKIDTSVMLGELVSMTARLIRLYFK